MTLEWTTEVSAADWWVDQLDDFASGVGSLVPKSFEAVTRLFHPIEIDGDTEVTWAEVAQRNGRVAHAEMQLHAIATQPGTHVPSEWKEVQAVVSAVGHPWAGELGEREFQEVADVLAAFTSTPADLFFAFWDGYGGFTAGGHQRRYKKTLGIGYWGRKVPTETSVPNRIVNGPRIKAPSRNYVLARGTVVDIAELVATDRSSQRPNMWWPADRAWFVATEIDFAWTYIGGSSAAIEAIEAAPGIEALRTAFDHQGTITSDRLNT